MIKLILSMLAFWLLIFVLCFSIINHNHKSINDTISDNTTLEKIYQLQRMQGY